MKRKRELNNSSELPKYFLRFFLFFVLLDQNVSGSSAASLPQNVFHRIIKNQNKNLINQEYFGGLMSRMYH